MGCRGPFANYPQDDYGNFTSTIKLYNWVFNNFSYKTIFKAGDPIQREPVDKAGEDAAVILRPKQEITCLLPNDVQDSEIVTNIVLDQTPLVAPIAEDAELGTANIYYNGELLKSVRLVTFDEVKLEKGVYFREKMAEFFSAAWIRVLIIIAVLAIIVYLTLLVRYRIMRKRHLKRRKAADQYRQAQRSYNESEQQRIQSEMRGERRFSPPVNDDPTQRFSDREDATMRYNYQSQRQQNHRFTAPDDDPYERYYGSAPRNSQDRNDSPYYTSDRSSRFADSSSGQRNDTFQDSRVSRPQYNEPQRSRFSDASGSKPSQSRPEDYAPKFADPESFQPFSMPDDLQGFSSVDPSVRDNADTDIDELLRSLGLDT